jgi:hypothetical protein
MQPVRQQQESVLLLVLLAPVLATQQKCAQCPTLPIRSSGGSISGSGGQQRNNPWAARSSGGSIATTPRQGSSTTQLQSQMVKELAA